MCLTGKSPLGATLVLKLVLNVEPRRSFVTLGTHPCSFGAHPERWLFAACLTEERRFCKYQLVMTESRPDIDSSNLTGHVQLLEGEGDV